MSTFNLNNNLMIVLVHGMYNHIVHVFLSATLNENVSINRHWAINRYNVALELWITVTTGEIMVPIWLLGQS